MLIQWYSMDIHGIYWYINIKKGTKQTHLYYSWYIPHIFIRSTYAFDIHGIYSVYTRYNHKFRDIIGVNHAYPWHIEVQCTLHIPEISTTYSYNKPYIYMYIHIIYHVYITYISHIPYIYITYSWHITYIHKTFTWHIPYIYIVYFECLQHPAAGVAEEGRVPFPPIHLQ